MYKSNEFTILLLFIIILCIFNPVQLPFTYTKQDEYIDTSELFQIYKATAPFGVFTLSGELDGYILFVVGSIGGTLTESETYIIKYLDGNQLKTVEYPAKDMPLTIDGRFEIEFIIRHYAQYSFSLFLIGETKLEKTKDENRGVIIHIPYLPDGISNMTTTWGK